MYLSLKVSFALIILPILVITSCAGVRLQTPEEALEGGYYFLRRHTLMECYKLKNMDEADSCLERNKVSYEEYKHQLKNHNNEDALQQDNR